MNLGRQKTHMFDFIFILALFCVFTASAFLAVVIGARVYRTTTANMAANYSCRTAVAYIAEKIRHNDRAGAVHLETIDNTRCLVLEAEYHTIPYQTYIYNDNGTLRELFIKASNTPSLSSGEEIMKVTDFSMETAGKSLYRLTISDDKGTSHSVYLCIRSDADGKGADI